MASKSSHKMSKSRGKRIDNEKLDEILGVVYKLSDDVQLMQKKLKKRDRKIFGLLKLLEESRKAPVVGPSSEFQGSCSCRSSLNQDESSGLRKTRLHLSFVCKLPPKLYTANIIYAIDDSTKTNVPMRVVLLDQDNKVVNDAQLSSLKIEVFVTYGDFKDEELEDCNWTDQKRVEISRVLARKEKGTLLLGCDLGTMENGICTFNDLKFGDNSSWVSCKTFKLVAKVADCSRLPNMVEIIRPAISSPFRVKDQRGKQYEKHSVPSKDDEVWRIERIRRDGPYHKKLKEEGITTVKVFLQRYYVDEQSLRNIIGAKDGTWATIVEHAKECNPNNEGFQYDSEEGVKLLFNCFYKLVSVSTDHQNALCYEDLAESSKSHVDKLQRRAFEDLSKLVEINSLSGWPSSATCSPFVLAPDPPQQDRIDPPPQDRVGPLHPHQVESMEDYLADLEHVPQESIWTNITITEGDQLVENLIDFPCPPPTPLFIDPDLLQQEETAAHGNAVIEDSVLIGNAPLLWNTFYHDLFSIQDYLGN